MKEDLLHYVWRLQRYDQRELLTSAGQRIEIMDRGKLNPDAGPDFLNAKIRIGETIWAGNVEMHVRASEWLAHRHQDDRAYDNVILHVVIDEDVSIHRADGQPLPCLEMRRRIAPKLFNTYLRLVHNEHWIPCQYHFYKASDLTKSMFLDRLLVERLERKRDAILRLLNRNQNDWENAFFQFLTCYLVGRINADAGEELARTLPINYFAKHADQPLSVEAFLFGQSGLLPQEPDEAYPRELRREYQFLRAKYGLEPAPPERWKFLRMRPPGFPTVRLAQLAALLRKEPRPFARILGTENISDYYELFDVTPHEFWQTHYRFGRTSAARPKRIGRAMVERLIINVIAPFLFVYDELRGAGDAEHRRALRLLEALPPERNKIVRGWERLGMEPESAYRTQGLLQLKNEYCDHHRCLQCSIGNSILHDSPTILREPGMLSWPSPESPQSEPVLWTS